MQGMLWRRGQRPVAHGARPLPFESPRTNCLETPGFLLVGNNTLCSPAAFGNQHSFSSALRFLSQQVAHPKESCGIPRPGGSKSRNLGATTIPFLMVPHSPPQTGPLAVPLGRSPALGSASPVGLRCFGSSAHSRSQEQKHWEATSYSSWAAFNMGRNTLKLKPNFISFSLSMHLSIPLTSACKAAKTLLHILALSPVLFILLGGGGGVSRFFYILEKGGFWPTEIFSFHF